MLQLNLPSYPYKLQKNHDGHLLIWDRIRHQYMVLTPEEWVRQHFVHFLVTYREFPPNLIRLEAKLRYDKLTKWADILVYSRLGNPVLMVECKAPTVKVSADTLHQLAGYTKGAPVPYLVLTNGLSHYYLHTDARDVHWLPDIPFYEELRNA